MHFLFVCSYGPSLLNFRGPLILKLLAFGHKVSVLAPSYDRDTISFLSSNLVDYYYYPLSRNSITPLKDIASIFVLFLRLIRIRPTHLVSYTIKPVLYSGLCVFFLNLLSFRMLYFPLITGLGAVFTRQNGSFFFNKLIYNLTILLYRLSLLSARKVIFQNLDDLNLFLSLRLVPDRNRAFCVNGSGVDTSLFSYKSPPSRFTFLMLSRLLPEKGVLDFVEAASIVKREYPGATFLLAGMFEPASSNLITPHLVQDWVSSSVIDYLGHVDNVLPLLNSCSVYVLPSYREGLPRSVIEAMSVGRPILTTDAPGCRDTVVDGYNGFLSPVKSPKHLAKNMIKLINLPSSDYYIMCQNSRSYCVAKFDVAIVNSRLLSIFLT